MKMHDIFPGKYLRCADLEEQDMPVTISGVSMEEMKQDGEAVEKLIINFSDIDKPLVCNKTNACVIADLYGDDTDKWVGKRITLWPNHDVPFGNKVVSAIRVRSRAPKDVLAAVAREPGSDDT